jgi:hypothetical protein
MNTVLKYERVILIKELDDRIKKVGDVFEIANILDDSFLLREAKSKLAVGVISFEDFDKHFVFEENYDRKWTNWSLFTGFDGQNDCMYRTNGRKVQCKFIKDKIKGESCCCKDDEFKLSFGLQLAYLRACNKLLTKQKISNEKILSEINAEITSNQDAIKKMMKSLGV